MKGTSTTCQSAGARRQHTMVEHQRRAETDDLSFGNRFFIADPFA
jgi:hypothetical protein